MVCLLSRDVWPCIYMQKPTRVAGSLKRPKTPTSTMYAHPNGQDPFEYLRRAHKSLPSRILVCSPRNPKTLNPKPRAPSFLFKLSCSQELNPSSQFEARLDLCRPDIVAGQKCSTSACGQDLPHASALRPEDGSTSFARRHVLNAPMRLKDGGMLVLLCGLGVAWTTKVCAKKSILLHALGFRFWLSFARVLACR